MGNEQIIQKYSRVLSQKIYDCLYLETQVESLDKTIQDKEKEIDKLKKILDENGISYKDKEEASESSKE